MPSLGGDPAFRDDDGAADPRVADALAAFAAGRGSEQDVLLALAGSRLLVPVLAAPAGEPPGSSRTRHATQLATPVLTGLDGRPAIPAFTCLAALVRWQPAARPVPVAAMGVWQSAAAESRSVVIDVAGPVPLAVEGARLAALADGRPAPPPCLDPDVRSAAAAALAAHPAVAGFKLAAGDSDTDLTVHLTLAAGCSGADAAALGSQAAAAIMAALPDRLRRGIAVAVARP